MGQKVNPNGMRIGINKGWSSNWIVDKKQVATFVKQDNDIRKFISKKYKDGAISRVGIERTAKKLVINIYTSKPGVVIGSKGAEVEDLKKGLNKLTGSETSVNVIEIKSPDLDAQLVAESICAQLEARVSFRRAMKQALNRCLKAGVKGVKIIVSGRLDGAEIARSESYHEGSIPLQTLRANIDYGFAEAHIYGKLGVKVWIYKGEILGKTSLSSASVGGNKHVDA